MLTQMLYIKNLHPKASVNDLLAIFGLFHREDSEWPKIRLMTGRMRGQAFVEFDCKFNLFQTSLRPNSFV